MRNVTKLTGDKILPSLLEPIQQKINMIWVVQGKIPKNTIGRVIPILHQQIIYAGR